MAGKGRKLAVSLVLLGALSAWALSEQGRLLRHSLETARLELRRTELLARYRLGLPLPGMPDLGRLDERLAEAGLKPGAPVLVRIFKQESELELWMRRGERFVRLATYPICKWAGELGPKQRQGDHQAPEGFYTVSTSQLNPNSRWHRSFNLGYPNALDRAHGRTGDFIMVHGGCSSVGCFAVTNEAVDEIWRLVTAALKGGQKRFQVQSYPFRLTDASLARHRASPWSAFWADLKAGHDHFEATGIPPVASVCGKRYVFQSGKAGSDGSQPVASACAPTVAHPPSGS